MQAFTKSRWQRIYLHVYDNQKNTQNHRIVHGDSTINLAEGQAYGLLTLAHRKAEAGNYLRGVAC